VSAPRATVEIRLERPEILIARSFAHPPRSGNLTTPDPPELTWCLTLHAMLRVNRHKSEPSVGRWAACLQATARKLGPSLRALTLIGSLGELEGSMGGCHTPFLD
jgi:hypothetical protein